MRLIFSLGFLLFSSIVTQAQLYQINPKGTPFYFSDAHYFNDGSVWLATTEPFIVKVPALNDTAWRENTSVLFTDSLKVDRLNILSKNIFTIGRYFTRDGGQSFGYLRDSTDAEVHFLNGQDWVVLDQQANLHYTLDAGASFTSSNLGAMQHLNSYDTSMYFYRPSDGAIYTFANKNLRFLHNWVEMDSTASIITWLAELQPGLFIYEQNQRTFFYARGADSNYIQSSNFFRAQSHNMRFIGNRIYRAEPTGTIKIMTDRTGNWASANANFTSPVIGFGGGYGFYNTFTPFVPAGKGTLSLYKFSSKTKTLLGENKHTYTSWVKGTSNDSLFYDASGAYFNRHGQILDTTGGRVNGSVFADSGNGAGILLYDIKTTSNNGFTWNTIANINSHPLAASNFGQIRPSTFKALSYAANNKALCVKSHYPSNWPPNERALVTVYNLADNSFKGATAIHPNDLVDAAFLNENLGLIITPIDILRTTNALATTTTEALPAPGAQSFGLSFENNQFLLSTSAGLWLSPDGINWTQKTTTSFGAKVQATIGNQYFGLKDYHLHYSPDGGNTVQKVLLPYSKLNTITAVDTSGIFLSGPEGVLVAFNFQPGISLKDISSKTQPNLSFFPNPATEQFYIELPDKVNTAVEVRVYSHTGELQNTAISYTSKTRLAVNISHLKPGVYSVICLVNGKTSAAQLLRL